MSLFVTEKELAAELKVAPKELPGIVQTWQKAGFPRRDALTGNYYMRAVTAWLDKRYNVASDSGPREDGEENW